MHVNDRSITHLILTAVRRSPTHKPQSSKERIMHIKHARGHLLSRRRQLTMATLIIAFCATLALVISPASPALAAPDLTDEQLLEMAPSTAYQYDVFKCPVETWAEGRFVELRDPDTGLIQLGYQVTVNTKIGHNGDLFWGCFANVFVDVIDKHGVRLEGPVHLKPWTGGASSSWHSTVATFLMSNARGNRLGGLDIRQTHRNKGE
jgi:hypothetical protein